jgi:hypothetical protein
MFNGSLFEGRRHGWQEDYCYPEIASRKINQFRMQNVDQIPVDDICGTDGWFSGEHVHHRMLKRGLLDSSLTLEHLEGICAKGPKFAQRHLNLCYGKVLVGWGGMVKRRVSYHVRGTDVQKETRAITVYLVPCILLNDQQDQVLVRWKGRHLGWNEKYNSLVFSGI